MLNFGTKMASSMRMMHALRFPEKKFNGGKIGVLAYFGRFFAECHFLQKHSTQWRHV